MSKSIFNKKHSQNISFYLGKDHEHNTPQQFVQKSFKEAYIFNECVEKERHKDDLKWK